MDDYEIECYNSLDETVNFGTRCLAEGNEPYEAVTLCVLKRSKQGAKSRVVSFVRDEKIYVSLGKILYVFADMTCTSLACNMKLDHPIEQLCINRGYLLVCLRNGIVYVVDAASFGIVHTRILTENLLEDRCYVGCFVDEEDKDRVSFLVVCKAGSIIKVSLELEGENQSNLSVDVIYDSLKNVEVVAKANHRLLLSGNLLVIYDLRKNDVVLATDKVDLIEAYKYNDNQFIGLTAEGTVLRICPLMIHDAGTEECYSSILFDELNETMCYALLRSDTGKTQVQKIRTNDFSQIYSINLTGSAQFVRPESIEDEVLLVSKLNEHELRIQMIKETSPEKRLERLIRKGMFDEAESFAMEYGLDEEIVRMARADVYVHKSSCSSAEVDTFLGHLDGITDLVFKLRSCLNVSCDLSDDVKKVLRYGSSLDKSKHNVTGESYVHYFTHINETLFKFDIYTILNRLNHIEYDQMSWHDFIGTNLSAYLLEELKMNNVEAAMVLYSRMDIKLAFEQSDIAIILGLLKQMSLNISVPFLYTFIPRTLTYRPEMLQQIIVWISDKVFYIERNNFRDFPESAVSFLDDVLRMLNTDVVRNCRDKQAMLEQLFVLRKALNTILVFKNNFKVFIPLEDCLKGPVSIVHALLYLDSVEINESLMKFITKFLIEGGFDPNVIYAGVIKELIAFKEEYWTDTILPIWKAIGSTNVKLNSVMLILKYASLPWSPVIQELLKESVTYTHPLVKNIETQIKQQPIYTVLDYPKYKLKSQTMASINDKNDMFAVHRIIHCREPSMVEDVYTLCVVAEKKVEATKWLLEEFLREGKVDRAIELIEGQDVDFAIKIFENTVAICRNILEDKYESNDYCHNMIKFLELVMVRKGLDEFEDEVTTLKATLTLRTEFGVEVADFERDNFVEKIELGNSDTFRALLQSLMALRNKLPASAPNTDAILLKLCGRRKDQRMIRDVADFVRRNSTDGRVLLRTVSRIFDGMATGGSDLEGSFDGSVVRDSNDESVVDSEVLRDCLRLARQICVKVMASPSCDDEIDLCSWINVMLANLDDCKEEDRVLSRDIYYENVNLFSPLTTNTLAELFLMYVRCISQSNPKMKYLLDEAENASLPEVEVDVQIMNLMRNLWREGNYIIAYNSLAYLRETLQSQDNVNESTLNVLRTVLDKCNSSLIKKVFEEKHVNTKCTFNLLVHHDYEKATKIIMQAISLFKRNLENLEVTLKLGLEISAHYDNPSKQQFYRSLLLLTKWRKNTENCTIPIKDFFLMPIDELLGKLIQQSFTLDQIQSFCKDFNLNVGKYYMIYLRKLLVTWTPSYVVEDGVDGRQAVFKNDEAELLASCCDIIALIEDKRAVIEFVNNLSKSINVYYYEVFLCIYKIVLKLGKTEEDTNKNNLLKFLKTYQRSSEPGETEMEEWFLKFPDTLSIDPLSRFRIPFTPTLFTGDLWNILRGEVNLKNYTSWFAALPILTHLNKDDMCTYVIKAVIKKEIDCTNSTEWSLHSKYHDLFVEIEKCIQNITDPTIATSVIYHISNHIPQGVDRVYALKLSYEYAQKYKSLPHKPEEEAEVNMAFSKVQKKYFNYSSMHILHSNNLKETRYLSLIGQPEELIEALYNDERIVSGNLLHSPDVDINRTVDQLAELYSFNIEQKRMALLENWLFGGTSGVCFNDSICLSQLASSNNLESNDLLDLRRAAYVCLSGDRSFWQSYLTKIGINSDESKFSQYLREARALQCLCLITPVKEVEELTDSTYEELVFHIDMLTCLHDLQSLGVNVTCETWNACNKRELLRRLSRHPGNPLNLKTMAAVCTIENLHDVKYWEFIVTNMIKLEMYDSLKRCIAFLKDDHVLFKDFYVKAWQCVINNSFNSTREGNRSCVESMHFIQSCPVLLHVDLEAVYHKCDDINRKDLAALFLQYFPVQKQSQSVKYLLRDTDKASLMQSVQRLFSYGLVGTLYVIDIIKEA